MFSQRDLQQRVYGMSPVDDQFVFQCRLSTVGTQRKLSLSLYEINFSKEFVGLQHIGDVGTNLV